MVAGFSKLVLRAYNNEADNVLRTLKPYTLDAAVQRLEKLRATIAKLGTSMKLGVTDAYHQLRVEELKLTADYLAKLAEEREREREERARLKEEEAARREFEAEQARLEKEKAHYEAALVALRATGDATAVARAEEKVVEIQQAIDGVVERAANIRAGNVYVISNIGSFGERMVKIGVTRRLEPLDRIRELGDASVPFRFDLHALFFSEDAVGIETSLHREFADRRVKLVSNHREFFYATPLEVKAALLRLLASALDPANQAVSSRFQPVPERRWHVVMLRMRMMIAIPSHLSDSALIAEVARWACDERHATAQLVAHLAELDARRLYLGMGHSSLFAYCHHTLGLSEDAAYNRVEAARACRLFPSIIERLVDGSLTLTSVRLLARHLTAENHRELIVTASHRSKREVEELIAHRFPKPDTPSSVKKVLARTESRLPVAPARPVTDPAQAGSAPTTTMAAPESVLTAPETVGPRLTASTHRPAVKPLAADRYEIRFTASAATRDKLKVAQDLLRHVIPSGDLAAIFDRALSELIETHARTKMAVVRRPARARAVTANARGVVNGSRHVAAEVKRVVWARDAGCCTFLGTTGHRCRERAFLEYHHVLPYAVGGEATVANIQLRCRAHNGYEADVFFGSDRRNRGADGVAERPEKYAVSWVLSPVPERAQRQHGAPGPRRQTG